MDEIISLDDSDRRALARAEFAESWYHLRTTADGVKGYLRTQPTSVFYSPHPHHSAPEEAQAHIVASVNGWFYDEEQLPNETRKYHGAVALPEEGLLEMQRLNDAKARFMAAWDRLRRWVEGRPETGESGNRCEPQVGAFDRRNWTPCCRPMVWRESTIAKSSGISRLFGPLRA